MTGHSLSSVFIGDTVLGRASSDAALCSTPAVLERNLERYPFALLSNDTAKELALEPPFGNSWSWTAKTEEQCQLPGPFDADLYVALCQVYNHQGRPSHGAVRIPTRTLAEVMNRAHPGGGFYDAVHRALHRLARVSISAVQRWEGGSFLNEGHPLHIFTSAEIVQRPKECLGGTEVIARFSDVVTSAIAEGHHHLLDTQAYFALQGPTAKRLYRYLDLLRLQSRERTRLSLKLIQLNQELPVRREAPSHIKRTLETAHQELIAAGFLEGFEYEEHPIRGRKRGEHWVTYRLAEFPISHR